MGVSGRKWVEVERRAESPTFHALKEIVERMFLGQYQHALDDKGRLTIPAAFRDALAGGAYIAQGFDRNLMVMTSAYFQQVRERLSVMSVTDPSTRSLRRLIYSSAYPVEVDKAGRILVPQSLRQFLGMNGEAMVIGQDEYFEIFTPAEWNQQMQILQDTEANAQRFQALDLGA